jgi:S-(hydroxymethyl)glutathione dehydrogenase/alcohol dehydrogenase
MRTRAAIIRESPGKFEVVDLELEDPRQDEIQVRMVASGLCHSDDHVQTGDIVAGYYPMVWGHEGAGVVEAVGPNTKGWKVGDHALFQFLPSCGRCRWCASGMSNLCDIGAYTLRGSRFDDPDSFRLDLNGTPVGQVCGLGTFSEHTTVSVQSAINVDKDLPLDKIVLAGCGVGTGWGSAVYAAEIIPGDVVIIMGIGGIGINAVQGASHVGAGTIIAVDPVAMKREVAQELGATHAFETIQEADEFAKSVTNGQGADKAIVTVGVVKGEHIAQAFAAIRKAGTVVVTGLGDMNSTEGIPVNPWELTMFQKRLQGALYGQCNAVADIPRQLQMYRNGQLKLDELITTRYKLDDIGRAYEDMHAGKNIRGVIMYD